MVLVEDQKRTTPRYWSGLIDLSVIPLSGEATEINQVHLNVMGVFDCGVGAFSVSTSYQGLITGITDLLYLR